MTDIITPQHEPAPLKSHLEKIRKNERGEIMLLGLDLATMTGAAYVFLQEGQEYDPEKHKMHVDLWDLSTDSYESGAMRFVRLRRLLHAAQPSLILFERVRYTPPGKITKYNAHAMLARAATQMELVGALAATTVTWAEERNIPCGHTPIGTIKKRATGKGNANKTDMISACNKYFGTDLDADDYKSNGHDNAADAAWIAHIAAEQYAQSVTGDEG